MEKKHLVVLEPEQRDQLQRVVSGGGEQERRATRAQILLKADQGSLGPAWSDRAIGEAFGVSVDTVHLVRRKFAEEGIDRALNHKRHPGAAHQRKLDQAARAHLVDLLHRSPPRGHSRWTLRLLADKVTELDHIDTVSHETIRQTLRRMDLDLHQKSTGDSEISG